jgi:hypothetical protein
MARLSALTSSAASEPTSFPRRLLGTAVTLSTIKPAGHTQSSPVAGLDDEPEDWCRRRIGGQGAHDYRIVRVESIILDDDRRPGLPRIGRATSDGPDLPPFHSAFQAEIASTNA